MFPLRYSFDADFSDHDMRKYWKPKFSIGLKLHSQQLTSLEQASSAY